MVVRHSPVVNGKGGEIEKLHGNAVKHYNRKKFHAHYSNLGKVIDMHRSQEMMLVRSSVRPFVRSSVRPFVRPSHFFPDNRSKDFSHFVYGYWAL